MSLRRPASATAPDRTPQRLIPPAVLARLANLELIARTVVEGALNGMHRSPTFGFSQEFAEYRDYVPGDDLRFVDWNAYARTDRLHVKRFEGETNAQLMVMVDASASMGVTRDGISKLDYARYLAASFVYLGVRQHDAVGLLAFCEAVEEFRPPSGRAVQQRALYHVIDALGVGGGTDWAAAFEFLTSRVTKRSIVAVISDFYCSPDDLGKALRSLGARGHDLLLVHLLDAAEREPGFSRSVTLRDAETGEVMEVDANELKSSYAGRLADHERALRREAGVVGAHYVRMNTDEPLDRALLDYLRFRARHP